MGLTMTVKRYSDLFQFYAKNALLMKAAGGLLGMSPSFRDRMSREWALLREQVAGHDSWLVVGNGPSLTVQDLESLSSMPAIASNKINLLFSRTEWRPRLYTVADPLLLHKLPAEHYDLHTRTLLPHTHWFMAKTKQKLAWKHIGDEEGYRRYADGSEALSPMGGVFVGRTVTVVNLQLAMWAGAKKIYLIGCDHSYSQERGMKGSRRVEHSGGSDHFDPSYRTAGEIVNPAPIELMDRAYAAMRAIADVRGVQIINISRNSALDAFARSTVEDAVRAIEGSVATSAAKA